MPHDVADQFREKILHLLHGIEIGDTGTGVLVQMARDIALLARTLPVERKWYLAERLRDVADQLERCDRLWR